MHGRRIPIQIIADILRLQEGGKTEIGLSANLGYHQLGTYLALLMGKGLLEQDNHRRIPLFHVTARGQELLECIDEVTQALGIEASYSDY